MYGHVKGASDVTCKPGTVFLHLFVLPGTSEDFLSVDLLWRFVVVTWLDMAQPSPHFCISFLTDPPLPSTPPPTPSGVLSVEYISIAA